MRVSGFLALSVPRSRGLVKSSKQWLKCDDEAAHHSNHCFVVPVYCLSVDAPHFNVAPTQ